MEYTDIRYSDHYYLYDSVSARLENWGPMVSKWILCGGEQSHADIIKAPNWNIIELLVMEYTDIRYSDITTCIDSVSARAAQDGDGWSPNDCVGDSSLMLT